MRSIASLDESAKIETFHFFRMNTGVVVYVRNGTEWIEAVVKPARDQVAGPTDLLPDRCKTPLPDSVPLAYLTATDKAKKARPRKKMLRWIENIISNPDWFGSKETIDRGDTAANRELHCVQRGR